jgi:hypothetical protein
MADAPDTPKRDYRSTVFLPRTDFPMKAGLPQKEPAILARWQADDLYAQVRAARALRICWYSPSDSQRAAMPGSFCGSPAFIGKSVRGRKTVER